MSRLDDMVFKISELNSEFLEELTKVNAAAIFSDTGNSDHRQNWIEGKRLTAFTIIDRFPRDCQKAKQCICLPECCQEYLKEVNIQDVKRYKSYFLWESCGRKNNSEDVMVKEYCEACEQIMSFCDDFANRYLKCTYNNVLSEVDRRKISERRKPSDRRCAKSVKQRMIERRSGKERRSGFDRRAYNHRVKAAELFKRLHME